MIVIPDYPTLEDYYERFRKEAGKYYNHASGYSEHNLSAKAADYHQEDILRFAPEWFNTNPQRMCSNYDINHTFLKFDHFIGFKQSQFA